MTGCHVDSLTVLQCPMDQNSKTQPFQSCHSEKSGAVEGFTFRCNGNPGFAGVAAGAAEVKERMKGRRTSEA